MRDVQRSASRARSVVGAETWRIALRRALSCVACRVSFGSVVRVSVHVSLVVSLRREELRLGSEKVSCDEWSVSQDACRGQSRCGNVRSGEFGEFIGVRSD